MRELKFRAWDKRKRIMVYRNENDSADYWDGVYGSEIELINSLLNDSSYEFMQYTGLKDKNGTEIYECDIVKGRYYDNFSRKEFDIVCIVRWDKSGYWTFDGRDKRFTGGYLTDIRDIEVVGNKYENPEWLEEIENE